MKLGASPALGRHISLIFLPLKNKRLRDNQAENSVSVCENEKIRTTQDRGSIQFQVTYTLNMVYKHQFISTDFQD